MAKTLIAFFSRADENYFGGSMRYIEIGNTEIATGKVRDRIDGDMTRSFSDTRITGEPCRWRYSHFWMPLIFQERRSCRCVQTKEAVWDPVSQI